MNYISFQTFGGVLVDWIQNSWGGGGSKQSQWEMKIQPIIPFQPHGLSLLNMVFTAKPLC